MKTISLCLLLSLSAFAQYAPVPTTSYTALSTILNAKPAFTSGAGAPSSNCTAGLDFYQNSSNNHIYICPATNTWVDVLAPLVSTGTGIATVSGGVPGAAIAQPVGAVVGTSDTQTLTNKSIAGSEVNSGTVPVAQLPVATTGALGAVKPDGTSITISGGTLSAVSGGAGTVTVVGSGTLTSTLCATGGGSQTIQTPSANCTVDANGNIIALSFSSGGPTPSTSGILRVNGKTSGGQAFVSADVGGTAIALIMPTTNPTANQVLADTGSATCPTLPSGSPATCHQLAWTSAPTITGTNFTGISLATAVTGSLPHANIAATAVTPGSYTSANITVAADGSVTAAANGSGGGISTTTINCLGSGQTVTVQNSFFPKEVACGVYASQSAAIGSTTLYAPVTATGTYRLTEIITITATQGAGPTLNSDLQWADATGAEDNGCTSGSGVSFGTEGEINCMRMKLVGATVSAPLMSPYIFSAVSGTNITFSVANYGSAITTGRYTYELVLEQLR